MAISLKTHKMLWGNSGNKCSFPDCKIDLIIGGGETDSASIIGEEAHIVGKKEDGPRGKSGLSFEKRDEYDNLILLCNIHHKLIDDQEKKYSVELLREYKQKHETWVKENLSSDPKKENDDLIYAGYVEEFNKLTDVDNWKDWTSSIFYGDQPHIQLKQIRMFRELIEFIISRFWPGRYSNLEKAFRNFKNIVDDFISIFKKYAEGDEASFKDISNKTKENNELWTKRFYKIDFWDEKKYNELLDLYEYHNLLLKDLAIEMTRAINHLFDMVRVYLFPGFRIKEGLLLIEIGPFMDFSVHTIGTQYRLEEKEELYPGLRKFMEIRSRRSYHIGEGVREEYFNNIYAN